MHIRRSSLFLVGLWSAFALLGCGDKGGDTSGKVATTDPAPPVSKPADPAPDSKAPTADPAVPKTDNLKPGEKKPDDKPSTAGTTSLKTSGDIAASLKTEGYSWYGLDSKKPLDLVLKVPSEKKTYTGAVTFELVDASADKAHFNIKRSGGMNELLGDEKVEVRPDGVYLTGNSKGALSSPYLDLPANPKAGFKWHVKNDLKTSDHSMTEDMECEIVGVVSLKESGASVKALLVKTKGLFTLDGTSTPMTAQYWYQKGVGLVRTDIRVTPKGKTPVVMVMSRPGGEKS